MKKETTAVRLRKLMIDRNLKQVDIINLAKPYSEKYGIKLTKSDLSQYISGKVEPNQKKLFILAMALNVQEAWLMGLDVESQKKVLTSEQAEKDADLLYKFSKLSEENKKSVVDMVDFLLLKQSRSED